MDRPNSFGYLSAVGEFGPFKWWPDPAKCPHSNENACPTCDHDGYYRQFLEPSP